MPFDDEKTRQVDVMDDEPPADAQNERTLMVNPAELLAAGRPAQRRVVYEEAPSGVLQVLGGIGAFLLLPTLVLQFLPLLQGGGDMRQWGPIVTRVTLALAFGLLAVGFFGSTRRAGGFSVVAGVFAAIGVVGVLLGFANIREMAPIVTFATPAAWIVAGIWCFTALRATGGGLGVTTGIFATLGGLGTAGAGLMWITRMVRRADSDEFLGVFVTSLGLLAVASVLLGLTFILKVRKAGE